MIDETDRARRWADFGCSATLPAHFLAAMSPTRRSRVGDTDWGVVAAHQPPAVPTSLLQPPNEERTQPKVATYNIDRSGEGSVTADNLEMAAGSPLTA